MVAKDEVVAVGRLLGYDDKAIEVVIERAGGSLGVAKRRLDAKLASERRFVEREGNKRIAARDAERARVRHAKAQAKARQERHAKRQHMSLPQRLSACLEDVATLPGLGTGSIAGGGVAAQKESTAPPSARNEVADFYLVRVRALIGNFEREVDVELHGTTELAETSDERNRRIVRDYEGWPAHEVATFDRSVGSPDTVARARTSLGRTATRGLKVSEEAAA